VGGAGEAEVLESASERVVVYSENDGGVEGPLDDPLRLVRTNLDSALARATNP